MKRFAAIDGLRGIAILMVTALHLWGASGYPRLPFHLDVYPAFGYVGVRLFFALSGFCLFYPLAQARVTGKPWPRWSVFALRRAVRILPAYYIALAISALIWQRYGQPTDPYPAARHILAHAFFVHTLVKGTATSVNPPMWSLGVEIHYYLVFPLLALAFARWPIRAFVAAFAWSAICAGAGPHIPVGPWWRPFTFGLFPSSFLDFGSGMLAAHIVASVPLRRSHIMALCAFGLFGLIGAPLLQHLIYPWSPGMIAWRWQSLWSPCWGALIVGCVSSRSLSAFFGWRPLAAVGVVSYSLYLYQVLIVPAPRWFYPRLPVGPAWVALTLAVLATAGLCSYLLAERPFLRLRAALRSQQRGRDGEEVHRAIGVVAAVSAVPGSCGRDTTPGDHKD